MITPRRRSSRLRSQTPQKDVLSSVSPMKLSTLVEGNETPECSPPQANLDAKTPTAKLNDAVAPFTNHTPTSFIKTPVTAGRLRPDPAEMHPSHYQSASKKIASGKRLAFANESTTAQSPQLGNTGMINNHTPLQTTSASSNPFSSPTFDFRPTRPSTDLSSEAQRMMEEVREQATRIKVELVGQRDQPLHGDEESEIGCGAGNRKFATPKGKVGRYSDIHLQEFKKMDSIANHPSSFRTNHCKLPSATTSLKRTNTEAGLDNDTTVDGVKRSTSTKSLLVGRCGASISPNKHFKQQRDEDSSSRPSSQRDAAKAPTKTVEYPQSGNLTRNSTVQVTTPTKSSLVRCSSAKSLHSEASLLPPLVRSTSTKTLATPTVSRITQARTDGVSKYRNVLADTLTSVRSILRRPTIQFPEFPSSHVTEAATSTPKEINKHDMVTTNRALPDIPVKTPCSVGHREEKHADFRHHVSPGTPSPTKLPGSYPMLNSAMTYPSLEPGAASPTPGYRLIAKSRASVAGPYDFSFRSHQTIKFGQANSGGMDTTPTIRRVRASDAFGLAPAQANKLAELPTVPHGLSNKKRKRDSADDNEDENKENAQQLDSPSKRAKTMPEPKQATGSKVKMPPSSRIPKRKGGKPVLSLSRLAALAKPKERK